MRDSSERHLLNISAVSAALFALAGLVLGVLSGSATILFDSAYSLLSLGLAALSLLALKLVRQPANGRYPFGRLTIEPVIILVKGLVILLVCLASIILALLSLWQGGRMVAMDLALMFSVLSVLGCAGTWAYLSRSQHAVPTALVAAEQRQWQMDTWLSVAVLLGFGVAYALEQSPWHDYARYADPVMVLVIASYCLTVPVRFMVPAFRQLLFATPAAPVQQALRHQLPAAQFGTIRTAQVGSFLIAQLPGTLDPDTRWYLHGELAAVASQQHLRLLVVQAAT